MAKKMVSLEISDELREALRVKAFKEKLSFSALIRKILEEQVMNELVEQQKDTKIFKVD